MTRATANMVQRVHVIVALLFGALVTSIVGAALIRSGLVLIMDEDTNPINPFHWVVLLTVCSIVFLIACGLGSRLIGSLTK
jgi:choline-glycine betaine transporter